MTTGTGGNLKWKKFSEEEPICNSDILMTDMDNVWFIQSFDLISNFDKNATHWVAVSDFKDWVDQALKQRPYHCSENSCGNKND